jgi:hypothetical protein
MADGWGGARRGAGRKRDPMRPVRHLRRQQLNEARRLLESALNLQRMNAQPKTAVDAAIRAAQRIIRVAGQLELALHIDSLPVAKQIAVAKATLGAVDAGL